MSLEEFEKKPDPKAKRNMQIRSIKDLVMGILYLGIGIIIMFPGQFKIENENLNSTIAKIFAAIVLIYGAWRIYRGIKKDYFIDNE